MTAKFFIKFIFVYSFEPCWCGIFVWHMLYIIYLSCFTNVKSKQYFKLSKWMFGKLWSGLNMVDYSLRLFEILLTLHICEATQTYYIYNIFQIKMPCIQDSKGHTNIMLSNF